MALNKRVKIGGSYFKGYKLTVAAAVGDYIQKIEYTRPMSVSAISLTPTVFGDGDYVKIQRMDENDVEKDVLAETVYMLGAKVSVILELSAIEPFEIGEQLWVTYTSAAGLALTEHILVDYVR